MSYANRSFPPAHRSISGPSVSGNLGQSPVLAARLAEKKVELENLRELRDMSAGLARQMETLENKISTLSNGTEAVAAVLSNWHSILRAINLASANVARSTSKEGKESNTNSNIVPLPQTLVRIPVQQASQDEHPGSASTNG